MAVNPMMFLKLKGYKEQFEARHPRVVSFVTQQLLLGEIPEGTVLEVSIQRPGHEKVTTNMRVTAEDVELVRELKK